MKYMEWESGFNLGIESIDQQHRRLVDIINLVYESMHPGAGKDELSTILDKMNSKVTAIEEMLRYAAVHFKYEEEQMLAADYPGHEKHKKMHNHFANEARIYRDKFDSATEEDTAVMMRYLKDWLRGHILGEDKKYVPYLRKHRRTHSPTTYTAHSA